jgi:hypothetical protein
MMHKLTKTELKKFLKGLHPAIKVQVFMTPSKTHLAGYKNWIEPVEFYLGNDMDELERTIQDFKNDCCNNEDGKTVHYYLKGETQ